LTRPPNETVANTGAGRRGPQAEASGAEIDNNGPCRHFFPMDQHLRVIGPRSELRAFYELAKPVGFSEYRTRSIDPGIPQNAAPFVDFIFSAGGLKMAGTLASIVLAYLKGRASRSVTLDVKDGKKSVTLSARGYSEEDLQKLLLGCRQLVVFDPEAEKERKAKKLG